MSIQERKLAFYFLDLKTKQAGEDINCFSIESLKKFCEFANSVPVPQKMIDITQANKVVELRTIEIYQKEGMDFLKGLILSGKYNHSPDYLSKENGQIRETDKQMDEAYAEKTHFLGRIHTTGVELLFESRQAGASVGMVVKCLNKIYHSMQKNEGYFYYNPIAVNDLNEAIKELTRIKIGNVFYDKSYFTQDGQVLNNAEGMASIQDDIILTMKAIPRQTMHKKVFLDFIRKMGAEDSKINRVRIEGTNEKGNTIIDTLLTKKVNNVNVMLDEKGLVDDYSIFARMEEVFGVNE